jgi:hypothetical protein
VSTTTRAADVIDGVIRTATANAGANFTFAEVRGSFSGHELCSGDDWLHAVSITDIGSSYHPTAVRHSFSRATSDIGGGPCVATPRNRISTRRL